MKQSTNNHPPSKISKSYVDWEGNSWKALLLVKNASQNSYRFVTNPDKLTKKEISEIKDRFEAYLNASTKEQITKNLLPFCIIAQADKEYADIIVSGFEPGTQIRCPHCLDRYCLSHNDFLTRTHRRLTIDENNAKLLPFFKRKEGAEGDLFSIRVYLCLTHFKFYLIQIPHFADDLGHSQNNRCPLCGSGNFLNLNRKIWTDGSDFIANKSILHQSLTECKDFVACQNCGFRYHFRDSVNYAMICFAAHIVELNIESAIKDAENVGLVEKHGNLFYKYTPIDNEYPYDRPLFTGKPTDLPDSWDGEEWE